MRGFHPWRSVVFRTLLSAVTGLAVVAAGGLLTAVCVWKLGLPSAAILRTVSLLLWCLGGLTAGLRCGLQGRRHGMAEGGICGLLLLLFWGCGAVLCREIPHSIAVFAAALPLSGSIGGILGVNTKRKKPPA